MHSKVGKEELARWDEYPQTCSRKAPDKRTHTHSVGVCVCVCDVRGRTVDRQWRIFVCQLIVKIFRCWKKNNFGAARQAPANLLLKRSLDLFLLPTVDCAYKSVFVLCLCDPVLSVRWVYRPVFVCISVKFSLPDKKNKQKQEE